eukprot:TRINITY_DN14890_c0_g1_i4.p1 TRINITY_DN14890_c0_g1~~TRINITY_DN14890_c0_g1_i4.p1  ORF type:complete len:184 (-),score=35.85 TRINITY_DN14890_c0_g1_i4:31-582(-)
MQGLPANNTLKGSLIKTDYMSSMPPTFRTLNNLNNFSENMARILRKKEEEDTTMNDTSIRAKSYSEIQLSLAQEAKSMKGYQPPPEKRRPVQIKGLYLIDIPKEPELFMRAKKVRELVNPKAVAKERRQEEIDMKIMQKHRQQKIMKNKTLLAFGEGGRRGCMASSMCEAACSFYLIVMLSCK